MQRKDEWDWPFIIYAGRVWLRYTEQELWNMRPVTLFAMLKVHYFIENAKAGNKKEEENDLVYVDQIPGM